MFVTDAVKLGARKAHLGKRGGRVVAVAGPAFCHDLSRGAVAGDTTGDSGHEHIAR